MTGHALFEESDLYPFRYKQPADKQRGEGHLYVILFASGLVKVGRSSQPQDRVSIHVNVAAAHGVRTTRAWVSALHEKTVQNERVLIEFCRTANSGQIGEEYFLGAPFEEIVQLAESLTFDRMAKASLWRSVTGTDGPPPSLEEMQTYGLDHVAELVGCSVRWLNENADRFDHLAGGRRRRLTRSQIEDLVRMRIRDGHPRAARRKAPAPN